MKVLLVNGSPHREGCTYTALVEVAAALERNEVETEIMWLGNKAISGCLGCNACLQTGRCVIDDVVNRFLDKVEGFDAFVFGSPVHFAAATGAITSFMDRAFYGRGGLFRLKPAAAVVSCRRGGASAALDQLTKYFTISQMPVVSSQYWNAVHGTTPEEVRRDEEGLQTMRILGENMAWLLRSIEAGRAAEVRRPGTEPRLRTNFIR
ncbi:MAG: flavodoxin family protein [Rikenellaceae bacterium]|nr:flavodoxin family protein [Rikenellaceae bacterium]